jgi:hypothetical protein
MAPNEINLKAQQSLADVLLAVEKPKANIEREACMVLLCLE